MARNSNPELQKKPGPKPGGTWGTKMVEGRVVGRDNKVIPPDEVEDLAAIGCTNTDIARWFGIDDSTLLYNFKQELIKGRENLKISLRRAMLKNACVNLNAAVQIFLAKNMLGMSDQGMTTDNSKVLPFTDDDDDKPTAEQLRDMTDEYEEIKE
jgi:hypothetical protein